MASSPEASLAAGPARSRVARFLIPSISDFLFLFLAAWLFAAGPIVLLNDGDTGWHIRTGEYILNTRTVPSTDLFSFSKAGQPWFAWEWLIDILFAAVHGRFGLIGVGVLGALALAFWATLLFRYMIWRGASTLVALAATLAVFLASGVHYSARPHIATLLLLTVSLWIMERDLRKPDAWIWILAPLSTLWVNMHGGFAALFACLAIVCVTSIRDSARLKRYLAVTAACAVATLANPYGYKLHVHVARYATSDWIRNTVDEFQSPRFRSVGMAAFELLLFAGLFTVVALVRKGEWRGALLILLWAHAALTSMRHVPIYALVAAPFIADEASRWWNRFLASGPEGLRPSGPSDPATSPARGFSVWAPVLAAILVAVMPARTWRPDFPDSKFPVAAVESRAQEFMPAAGRTPVVFTTDQWGDYLIYKLYPRLKVFIDGRSDLYGPEIGNAYLKLRDGGAGWQKVLDDYGFNVVLLPPGSPLIELLKQRPDWKLSYDDGVSVVLEKHPAVAALTSRIPPRRAGTIRRDRPA
jgi:hypothetical protein